ncbi:hypothetical protein L4D08_06715 [Photobacterium chitinilyticum]|uniref:hypothetical protein n=1 Tax=Photobacterium chitinilyticum TaxID=2485123 RepID=UPI003D145CAC
MTKIEFDRIYTFITASIALMILGFGFTTYIWPESDFLVHWNQAESLTSYIKGGGLIFIYYPFKHLNLHPSFSASIVNFLSWILLAYSLKPRKTSNFHKLIVLSFVLMFGIWWIPSANNVDVMQPHVALLVFGIRSLYYAKDRSKVTISILVLSLAISMRMQTVLFLAPALGIYVIYSIYKNRKNMRLLKCGFCSFLLIATISGVFIELGLRGISYNDETIVETQRMPLYAGLFLSNLEPGSCGSWSSDAAIRAKEERDIPTYLLFRKYLSREKLQQLPTLVACKYDRMINIAPFASYLTVNYLQDTDELTKQFLLKFAYLELSANKIIKLLLMITIVYILYSTLKVSIATTIFTELNMLTIGLFVGILSVFSMFEFNSRYMFSVLSLVLTLYVIHSELRYHEDDEI